jgi:cysteine-rich repeat protein
MLARSLLSFSLVSLSSCSLFFTLASRDECSSQPNACLDEQISLFCRSGQLFQIDCGPSVDGLDSCDELTGECRQFCGDDFIQGGEECETPGEGNCNALCLFIPTCGDGTVEPREQCDDGNRSPNDGCNENCFLEPTIEREPNDSATLILGYPSRFSDGFDPAKAQGPFTKDAFILGDTFVPRSQFSTQASPGVDLFSIQNTDNKPVEIRVDLFQGSFGDLLLDTLGVCSQSVATLQLKVDDGTVLSQGAPRGDDPCEGLSATLAPQQIAYLQLSSPIGAEPGSTDYVLHLDFSPVSVSCGDGIVGFNEACDPPNSNGCDENCRLQPSCGDGITLGNEQCDDGNLDAGDGCDADCLLEGALPLSNSSNAPTELTQDAIVTINGSSFALLRNTSNSTQNIRLSTVNSFCARDLKLLFPDERASFASTTTSGIAYTTPLSTLVHPFSIVERTLFPGQAERLHAFGCDTQLQVQFMTCGDGVLEIGEECEPSLDPACSDRCHRVICGDGVFHRGEEQCDDGNEASGDGCDNACQIENLIQATAGPIAGVITDDVVIEGSNPAGTFENDFYEIQNNRSNNVTVRLELFSFMWGLGQACEGQPFAEFRLTDIGQLEFPYRGSNFDICGGNAFVLAPGQSVVLQADVGVVSNSPEADGVYLLQARFSECGNGEIELGEECEGPSTTGCNAECQAVAVCGDGNYDFPEEQCDDGNTIDGDACPSDCIVVDGALIEEEPNDRYIGPRQTITEDTILVGEATAHLVFDDYIIQRGQSPGNVRVDIYTTTGDLNATCGDSSIALISDLGDNIPGCNAVSTTLAAGQGDTITVFPLLDFDTTDPADLGTYILVFDFSECGNGVVEDGEQCEPPGSATCDGECQRIPTCGDSFTDFPESCDDGNTLDGDGCDADCEPFNAAFEVEPNNQLANANGPIEENTVVLAALEPAGDIDLFAITNPGPNPALLRLDTFKESLGVGVSCGDALDTILQLQDSAGNTLDVNDDRVLGADNCSGLELALAPGDAVFARVSLFDPDTTESGYLLQISLTPTVCGDGVIAPGEQCDDINTAGGDGCSAGCQLEGGFACIGEPSVCHPIICGDGLIDGAEQCDDGNTLDEDGCSSICQIEGSGLDCPANQTLLQIASTDVPKAIPDDNPAGVVSVVNIADNRSVRRVIVQIGDLTHTFDGDLRLSLLSPNNTEALLFDNRGSGGDNLVNTLFDDACTTVDGPISSGAAPFTGCFAPESVLSVLNTQPANGQWRLKLVDTAVADTGTLNAWTLGLCVQ